MKTYKQRNKGFTLVEVLIAAFIFAVVSAISVGIFASSAGTQIVTEIHRTAVQDERFLIDQVSRDIRLAQCGYEFCGSPSACGGTRSEGDYLIIYPNKNSDGTCDQSIWKMYGLNLADNTIEFRDENSNFSSLFSNAYKISSYNNNYLFSGYYPSSASAQQPYVTIQFNLENREKPAKEAENIKQTIITSVASRAYSEIGDWKK